MRSTSKKAQSLPTEPNQPRLGGPRVGQHRRGSKFDGLLPLKEFEIAEYLIGDAAGFGLGVKPVHLFGDLLNGVMTVAQLNDFEAGSLYAQ